MQYRFFVFSATGQELAEEEMAFENDAAALRHGDEFLRKWEYEIWQDGRPVFSSLVDCAPSGSDRLRTESACARHERRTAALPASRS